MARTWVRVLQTAGVGFVEPGSPVKQNELIFLGCPEIKVLRVEKWDGSSRK